MSSASLTSTRKTASAGCLIPFGLIFLAAGLAVCWFSWARLLTKVAEVRKWTATPCQVTQWETAVNSSGGEVYSVSPKLAYQYQAGGKSLTGTTYDVAESTTPTLNSLEEEGVAARRGPAVCYVNPAHPEESTFIKPTYLIGGAVLAFGAVFAAVGGGLVLAGIAGILRRLAGGSASGGMSKGCAGGIVAPLLSLVFAVAGFAVWKFAIHNQPDWGAISQRMVEVPAKVLASGVSKHTSSGKNSSTSYKAKVAFEYEYNGRVWRSGWLNFDQGSTSSSNSAKAYEAAARHPSGSSTKAWVDPVAPWQAVLEKTGGNRWWLWIFPIIFGGIGVLGLLGWLFKMTALGNALFATRRLPGGGSGM
ncbi:MAG: hypothetical protein JWL81_2732 [Verrucomicrobiales bacterium]|nr:hypothetical protein [Verrucomicrobiales bacterium]